MIDHPRRNTGLWTRLALCLLWSMGLVQGARAAALDEGDARAVRAVVEAQLAAFAANDAERAFSYATPAIRDRFGDAETFMAMVRAGYPMVLRPAAVAFFVPTRVDDRVLQKVRLRDNAGRRWLASYQFERLDGAWRINGCVVLPDSDKSST